MAAIIRTILTVFFVIDCIALSIVVLMQKGKEQGLGAIAGEMTTTTESYWDRNKDAPQKVI